MQKFWHELNKGNLQIGETDLHHGQKTEDILLNHFRNKWPKQSAKDALYYREVKAREKRGHRAKIRTGFERRHAKKRKKPVSKKDSHIGTLAQCDIQPECLQPLDAQSLTNPAELKETACPPVLAIPHFDDFALNFDPFLEPLELERELMYKFDSSTDSDPLPEWARASPDLNLG